MLIADVMAGSSKSLPCAEDLCSNKLLMHKLLQDSELLKVVAAKLNMTAVNLRISADRQLCPEMRLNEMERETVKRQYLQQVKRG